MSIKDLVVIDSAGGAAATCVICGTDIAAGEGVTARFGGQTLRFKCPGCLSRFAIDPDRYLSDGPTSCCDDEHADASHAHCGRPDGRSQIAPGMERQGDPASTDPAINRDSGAGC